MGKGIIFASLFLCFLYSCTSNEKNSGNSKSGNQAASTGKAIYSKYCGMCHGTDGKKGLGGAFDLSSSTLTGEERIKVITYGRSTMPGYQNILNEEEIKKVADYVESLK